MPLLHNMQNAEGPASVLQSAPCKIQDFVAIALPTRGDKLSQIPCTAFLHCMKLNEFVQVLGLIGCSTCNGQSLMSSKLKIPVQLAHRLSRQLRSGSMREVGSKS